MKSRNSRNAPAAAASAAPAALAVPRHARMGKPAKAQPGWARLKEKLRAGSGGGSGAGGAGGALSQAARAKAAGPARAAGAPAPAASKRRKKSSTSIRSALEENAERKLATEQAGERQSRWQMMQQSGVAREEAARYLGLDCEMVGVGPGGRKSVLARATIVDWDGNVVYDKFVRPHERVTDFRTFVSGVKAKHLKDSRALRPEDCQAEVRRFVSGKILVGHALQNDLKVLRLTHPQAQTRDTAFYRPYMRSSGPNGGKLRPQKLKTLCMEQIGMEIQSGQHDSGEDARAAMFLYRAAREEWERGLARKKAVAAAPSLKQATRQAKRERKRQLVRSVDQVSGKPKSKRQRS